MRYIIYGLSDPRDGRLRYIGKSVNGLVRPRQHAQPTHLLRDSHKANWIRQLQSLGLTYTIEILEQHDSAEELGDGERWNIQHYRSMGCDLTNLTDGGDGTPGLKRGPHSDSHKAKLSASLKGRPKRPGFSEALSARQMGRRLSEETRRKIAAAKLNRPLPESHRLALSRSHGGRVVYDHHGVEYPSIAEAGRRLGIDKSSVRRALLHGTPLRKSGVAFSFEPTSRNIPC